MEDRVNLTDRVYSGWRGTALHKALPGSKVILRCWGMRRLVEVVSHDDCGLTVLRNLRTGSEWTCSSYERVLVPAS